MYQSESIFIVAWYLNGYFMQDSGTIIEIFLRFRWRVYDLIAFWEHNFILFKTYYVPITSSSNSYSPYLEWKGT